MEWFKTINISGVPLTEQEKRNAIFNGPFVTAAKKVFSNTQNTNKNKWAHYIKGDIKRQAYLECALQWLCNTKNMTVDLYMSKHRYQSDITELQNYFDSVIDWVSGLFEMTDNMCGLDWGRLYELFHSNPYDRIQINNRAKELLSDPFVTSKKNIYEYLLGGEQDKRLLNIRLFNESTKRTAYHLQKNIAKEKGISNCPMCAQGTNNNRTRIYDFNEMEADHVTAWSKGGSTSLENCQMLCKMHNRMKGNR